MSEKKPRIKLKWSWVVAVFFGIIIILIISAYVFIGSTFSDVISKGFSLPAAFVGSKEVSLGDYSQRNEILQKVPGNVRDENSLSGSEQKNALLEKMIQNKVAEIIAKREKVNVSDSDIQKAYEFRQKISGQEKLAEKYGMSETEFKNIFTKPEVINTKLAIALAGDTNSNATAHKKLKDAKEKLAQGMSFEDVAATFSDDEASAKIGGDVGFVSYKELAPEYFDEVSNVKDQKVHFVATRYGLYLFEVLDKDNSGPDRSARFHVKQVFIKTIDYSKWLQDQVRQYRILKFV
jgi:parvulin-like peptidyl-prolyl isomerase